MVQTSAVVLDKDPNKRYDIRIRLAHCGVLPICFKDEWMCLENIHYIRPDFAVVRPDSRETTIRFVTNTKAIQGSFAVVGLLEQHEIEAVICNNWLVNLIFLRYPAYVFRH